MEYIITLDWYGVFLSELLFIPFIEVKTDMNGSSRLQSLTTLREIYGRGRIVRIGEFCIEVSQKGYVEFDLSIGLIYCGSLKLVFQQRSPASSRRNNKILSMKTLWVVVAADWSTAPPGSARLRRIGLNSRRSRPGVWGVPRKQLILG